MGASYQPGGGGGLERGWKGAERQSPGGSNRNGGASDHDAAQTLKTVVGQQTAEGGNQVAATVELLKAIHLHGELVTADAALLCKRVTQSILDQGGDYLGSVKGNEAELKQAVDDWLTDQFSPSAPGSASGSGGVH
jgi:hypothetical protein